MKIKISPFLWHLLLCAVLLGASPAYAYEDADAALGLSENPGTGKPRFPYPISTIVESVTVLNADDISRLNAHTLAEILQTVPGVQLLQMQTPGSRAAFSVSGSHSRHILVLIDGVAQNLLGAEESAELGMIPAQYIERVEIIKGPASTAWGTAIGGVVNVTTKSPDPEKRIGGLASGSYGTKATSDSQAEVSGTLERFGYYLNGGRLHSQGLLPGNNIDFNHAYGKFTYSLPVGGSLTAALDYRDGDRGVRQFEASPGLLESDTESSRYLTGVLRGQFQLSSQLSAELNGNLGRRQARQTSDIAVLTPSTVFNAGNRDDYGSLNGSVAWRDSRASLIAGIAYQHDDVTDNEPVMQFDFLNFHKRLDRYSTYLNGSYAVGPLTILPGIRFENTNHRDNSLAYNLGATLRLSENNLFRLYAGRGHGLPVLNFQNGFEDIWTVQAGLELGEIKYLWLKGSCFYSDTWHIESPNVPADYPASPITTSLSAQKGTGFELEAQTVPLYGVYLKGGYTYTDVRDKQTNARADFIPINSLKLAINYDHADIGLRSTLACNYVTWPGTTGNQVVDDSFIWDLHLSQKLRPQQELSPEVYLSVHNLFNGAQYIDDFQRNAPRWVEAGLRLRF